MKGFHSLKVSKIQKETPDSVSIEFEIPDEIIDTFKFVPGQHLTLRLDYKGDDIRRTYSLCSGPDENKWRVGIKKVPDGIFSTYANERLSEGDTVQVMPPQGRFTVEVDPKNEKHYVAFAAGSGITPVLSILKAILHSEPRSNFTLFYGNKSRHTVMFREEIEGLKNEFLDRLAIYHIFTREESETQLFNGRMDKEKIRKLCQFFAPVASIDEAFLCGPKDMIFNGKEMLEESGLESTNIHFELFYSGDDKISKEKKDVNDAVSSDASDVALILDGRKIKFKLDEDGPSILDAALHQGADLPFACKGGVCATCKAKLVRGEVSMDVNYALEEDELDSGYILTCQSHPKSKKIKVNFDA